MIKAITEKTLRCGAIVALAFVLVSCYSIRTAIEFTSLYLEGDDLDSLLSEEPVSPRTREKLLQVKSILAFADGSGLLVGGAYRRFVKVDRSAVSYLVYVAEPDRLESKTWWFPFVGSVPYLGYFDRSERDEEAQNYRKQGFDVYVGGAAAFSSLGWFDDPLFSSMLDRPQYDLANLIFHELVHRTVWKEGFPKFNENLATFMADVLTQRYLKQKGSGDDLRAYQTKKRDRERFVLWLKAFKGDLEKLYADSKTFGLEHTLREKRLTVRKFTQDRAPKFEAFDYVGSVEWNNAAILASSLYQPEWELFEAAFQCVRGDSAAFLSALKKKLTGATDPFLVLRGLCSKVEDV